MGSKRKEIEKPSKPKTSLKNPNNKNNNNKRKSKPPLQKRSKTKKKQLLSNPNDNYDDRNEEQNDNGENDNNEVAPAPALASMQLRLFLDLFQSANGVQLSSLELESFNDRCIVELSQCTDQDTKSLGKDMKVAFGPSWKEVLCEKQLLEGKVDPGSPAILVISSSAMRSIELLRGLRSLTKECPAVKLFSKHMKVEDQALAMLNFIFARDDETIRTYCQSISNAELYLHEMMTLYNLIFKASAMLNYIFARDDDFIRTCYHSTSNAELYICTFLEMMTTITLIIKAPAMLNCIFARQSDPKFHVSLLKNRVNIASGTPSRIKKLIDIEALGLSRLAVIVLDLRPDVKGYSLFTLPQVRDEFWELYKNYFHQRLAEGSMRLGLYGPLPTGTSWKAKKRNLD